MRFASRMSSYVRTYPGRVLIFSSFDMLLCLYSYVRKKEKAQQHGTEAQKHSKNNENETENSGKENKIPRPPLV